ncbi:MAG: ribbon-helix-helix protein, CopG family [Armatimonadota bacterium]
MRTTIDLPDALYRSLKARAALSGVTMRDLIRHLVEQGLRQPGATSEAVPGRREPPPVIIPPRGVPIPAIPRAELRRLEEEEDEAQHARSARR